MKRRRYQQQYDGDTISPRMDRPYRMMCCDCGLVHKLRFSVLRLTKRKRKGIWEGKRVLGHKIVFKAWRDRRATAATRRRKGGVITLRRR